MTIRFGTDGVRGLANEAISVEVALAVGRATARTFGGGPVVIGRDTRRSGPMLESAVLAGVCAEGLDALTLGIVPTPAVASVCAARGVAGIMISASHNPFEDNGLKVFAPGGRKLSDAQQATIEALIADVLGAAPGAGPTGSSVGVVLDDDTALDGYLDGVAAAIGGRGLDGVRLVLDCANGSNSRVAPGLLERLGADVSVICAEPDGTNINAGCGSTHPEALGRAVRETGSDLGIAFDGDADRMLAVDHAGEPVDGDQIIALCAADLAERDLLTGRTVVVTVMSNLGFHRAMADQGIQVVTTPVGDRYVLEALVDGGYSLGGEQSGHIIFADHATTGDGLLSAVVLVDLVRRSGRQLAELAAAAMTRLPQVLVNVRVAEPMPDVSDRLAERIRRAEADLDGEGRILLRPSGTEPVVRVMAEAPTIEQARAVATSLAEAVESLAAGG
jgi:phosphoglucosamine mutase